MVKHRMISYKLDKKVLFDKLCKGENFLLLYDNTNNHQQLLRNFAQQLSGNNSVVFFVSHATSRLKLGDNARRFSFNVITEPIINELKSQLDRCFKEREKNKSELLLICEWSKADLSKCGLFFPFLEILIKKSRGLSQYGWKGLHKGPAKTPFTLVNAFDANTLEGDFIQKLIRLHHRVYILQESANTFLLPTISPSLEAISPKFHVLAQDVLEKIAKDNLELLALVFLERKPCSGYQLLKEIAQHFHCILSQGTLYPLLYQMEKENKIMKQNGKGREVIYSLAPQTETSLGSMKEVSLQAYQHMAGFLGMQE